MQLFYHSNGVAEAYNDIMVIGSKQVLREAANTVMEMMMETLIFILSAIYTVYFLVKWYRPIFSVWPLGRAAPARTIMGLLPFLCILITMFTLRVFAAFDVVEDFYYVMFYILLGFVCLGYGIKHMEHGYDMEWRTDAIELNNTASIFPLIGGLLAVLLIYCGANIGDGPGWWCVLYAGGIGFFIFIKATKFFVSATNASENITVLRDKGCGIRFGALLLSLGIILGRASGGDWYNWLDNYYEGLLYTILDFYVAWPGVLLFIAAYIFELALRPNRRMAPDVTIKERTGISLVLGAAYIGFSIATVSLMPSILQ